MFSFIGEPIPSDDVVMLIPNELPRTLGLAAVWFKLDIPATLNGEPLYCTEWECE